MNGCGLSLCQFATKVTPHQRALWQCAQTSCTCHVNSIDIAHEDRWKHCWRGYSAIGTRTSTPDSHARGRDSVSIFVLVDAVGVLDYYLVRGGNDADVYVDFRRQCVVRLCRFKVCAPYTTHPCGLDVAIAFDARRCRSPTTYLVCAQLPSNINTGGLEPVLQQNAGAT
jgi:hypothetical protein